MLSLLVITALLFWFFRFGITAPTNKKSVSPDVKAIVLPAADSAVLKKDEKSVLDLSLPADAMLMDSVIPLPERQHQLDGLFKNEAKEPKVKIGGNLILDEKPPEPNAGMWDAVKGAEVGITIKTP